MEGRSRTNTLLPVSTSRFAYRLRCSLAASSSTKLKNCVVFLSEEEDAVAGACFRLGRVADIFLAAIERRRPEERRSQEMWGSCEEILGGRRGLKVGGRFEV